MSGSQGSKSPYHSGEVEVQLQVGGRDAALHGAQRSIRDYMPDQHREFFRSLPYLFVGTIDKAGRPWASVIVAAPGFASSPDPTHLTIAAMPTPGDPAREGLHSGYPVSVVGVEFHTRRRNRLNGRVTRSDEAGFEIQVDQSYGNCPQYIQARQPIDEGETFLGRAARLEQIDDASRQIIEAADTCFIASFSSNPDSPEVNQGVDVNHRGGRPGFLRLARPGEQPTITFPDFVGNFFFNTLGNIAVNPVAGLLIPDFATGSAISLTGRARIIWEGDRLENFAGAERLVEIAVEQVYRLENVIPRRWSESVQASQLVRTGTWRETDEALSLSKAGRPAAPTSRRDHHRRMRRRAVL